eukprot:1928481-Pyramimonas_sp.AAC.1
MNRSVARVVRVGSGSRAEGSRFQSPFRSFVALAARRALALAAAAAGCWTTTEAAALSTPRLRSISRFLWMLSTCVCPVSQSVSYYMCQQSVLSCYQAYNIVLQGPVLDAARKIHLLSRPFELIVTDGLGHVV